MTKDELFARMADAYHVDIVPDSSEPGRDCGDCVRMVEADMIIYWPLIVEFVARWLDERRPVCESWGEAASMAEDWREAMS